MSISGAMFRSICFFCARLAAVMLSILSPIIVFYVKKRFR